jgi:hypothetical protein
MQGPSSQESRPDARGHSSSTGRAHFCSGRRRSPAYHLEYRPLRPGCSSDIPSMSFEGIFKPFIDQQGPDISHAADHASVGELSCTPMLTRTAMTGLLGRC